MATLAEINVVLNANLLPLQQASRVAEKRIVELERKLERAGKGTRAFRDAATNVNTLAASVSRLALLAGGALSVGTIKQYADAWTEAGNKIRAAEEITGVQARSLEEVNKLASQTRSGLTETADLYAKLIRSASGVAKSEEEIAIATMTVNKAFKAGGATMQEQIAGITQLGQALGSGVLQGDELRSLRENAPIIAQAIADEFKTTIAGLKDLGAEGKLTSDRVFKAIINAQKDVDAAFGKTNKTIEQSFTTLRNSVIQYVGQMDQTLGITQTVTNVMGLLEGNINSVANALIAAGLAITGLVAGPMIVAALANPFTYLVAAIAGATFAISQFWDEIVPLEGSFATLGDYAQAAWEMISDGATIAKESVVTAFQSIMEGIESTFGDVGSKVAGYYEGLLEGVKTYVNTVINYWQKVGEIVVHTFSTIPAAVAESAIDAMNGLLDVVNTALEKITNGINTVIGAANALSGFFGGGAVGTEWKPLKLEIENSYKGAGKKFGEGIRDIINKESVDYVGKISGVVQDGVKALTNRANQIANERIRQAEMADKFDQNRPYDGSTNTAGFGKGSGLPGSSAGGGKKGGGRSKQSDYEKEIKSIQEKTAALVAETEAQRGLNLMQNDYGFAVERAKAAQELLTAAKNSGIAAGKELADVNQLLAGDFSSLTPAAQQQAQAMLQLATSYAEASVAAAQLEEQQERTKNAMDETRQLGRDVLGGFINDLRAGKSASEALANALSKVADKLMDIGLDALFGTGSFGGGGGGLFGNLFGAIFGGFKAKGGPVESGKSYIVGENGPEVFKPNGAGVIVPNHQLNPSVRGSSRSGGDAQEIRIELVTNTDTAVITEIAKSEVKSAAPAIIKTSIVEGQKQTKANMPSLIANAQNRSM